MHYVVNPILRGVGKGYKLCVFLYTFSMQCDPFLEFFFSQCNKTIFFLFAVSIVFLGQDSSSKKHISMFYNSSSLIQNKIFLLY